jgi:hypothetical protein
MTCQDDLVVPEIDVVGVSSGDRTKEGEDNSFLGQSSEHLAIKTPVFIPVVR